MLLERSETASFLFSVMSSCMLTHGEGLRGSPKRGFDELERKAVTLALAPSPIHNI